MRKEFIVGAVFLAAVALALFGTIAVSGLDLLTPKVVWQVELKDLGGLEVGDDVRVLGHLMGVVDRITFDREKYVFRAFLKMAPDAPVHEGYKITVRDTTALGGKHLYVEPGSPKRPAADHAKLVGEPRAADLIATVSDVATEVKKIAEKIASGEGTLGKLIKDEAMYNDLAEASKSLKTIAERVEKGQGVVGRLINEDEIYVELKKFAVKLNNENSAIAKLMSDESGSIVDDLRSASASIKSVAMKVDEGSGTIGRLVNDGGLYERASATVGKAADIIDDARAGKGTVGRLLTSDELYNSFNSFAKHIDSVSAKVDEGNGTIGKLISDPELYEKVKKLVARAIDTIENARDSAPVSAITSFIFGPFQ